MHDALESSAADQDGNTQSDQNSSESRYWPAVIREVRTAKIKDRTWDKAAVVSLFPSSVSSAAPVPDGALAV